MTRVRVAIHCEPAIPWQAPFARKLSAGLMKLGIGHVVSGERQRDSDVAILLGTSMWRQIEADGHSYLLVDRCSFGDTNEWVSLVWDAHGRRGDHKVPHKQSGGRLRSMLDNGVLEVSPWCEGDPKRIVIAGQTESYSPHWRYMPDWYAAHPEATYFRPHPAQPIDSVDLPIWDNFDYIGQFVTLNSSVAVSAILNGVPTSVDDEGGMAWPGFKTGDDRIPWLRWLVWTQWSHDEIAAGVPIKHLFADML